MPKFVLCKFRKEDTRSYTYLLDGHDVAIGDEVKVPDNRSDGWKRVHVAGFTDDEPAFACKAVLGLAPPREDDAPTEIEARDDDDLSSPVAF